MEAISRYLDHAVLIPEMARIDAAEAIELGAQYNVRTVCVRPCDIDLALMICKGTGTSVITVLNFPHGCAPRSVKAFEAQAYIQQGVAEIDMVANYGLIRSGLVDDVAEEIAAVARETKKAGVLLKVIVESGLLNEGEVTAATLACIQGGADFIKTSTGFNGPGASEEAVKAMLEAAAGRIAVKASGGIRDYELAMKFMGMGVQRLGVGYKSTKAICEGAGIGQGY